MVGRDRHALSIPTRRITRLRAYVFGVEVADVAPNRWLLANSSNPLKVVFSLRRLLTNGVPNGGVYRAAFIEFAGKPA